MTNLGDKFEEAGFSRREIEFGMSAMRFFKAGGSAKRAIAVISEVAVKMKLPGAGQNNYADKANDPLPASRQPVEDAKGLSSTADKAYESLPSASSPRPPVPAPNKPRGLTSIVRAQQTVKQGYLIMLKTSDGRSWGNVGWHELPGMRRDGNVADMILRWANPPKDQCAKLNTVLTDAQFAEIHNASQARITAAV